MDRRALLVDDSRGPGVANGPLQSHDTGRSRGIQSARQGRLQRERRLRFLDLRSLRTQVGLVSLVAVVRTHGRLASVVA